MSRYNPSLRTRIYISMLALILLSLLIIGITTILFFDTQNESYHIERLKRKEKTVAKSLQYFLKEIEVSANMSVVRKDFVLKVTELADINNVEINIFTTDGEILISSKEDQGDPDFFKIRIDPIVLRKLQQTEKRQVQNLDDDHVSTFAYMKDDQGNKIAIVNIPYSLKDSPNKEELAPFLTTLIEIYIFLLIGASLIAYFLSNYITKSLRVIADNLKKVKISQKNSPLEWNGEDEIGALVDEYNHMIGELEQSAHKLAKSERESAWREMAKQVAHEIKNPLTPMKLSVQHLERALDKNDDDFQEKLSRFSNKMIQQIDTLTSIANEFSHFAKMPKANMEEIDLKEVVSSTFELFDETEHIHLIFTDHDIDQANITGDREQLNRVFNNLIKNAIQSIPDEREGQIEVKLSENSSMYKIEVKDNGSGIPEDLEGKIFVPNFTTKSTGTGLGLAMVKQIIESHHGDIRFVTKVGVGTSFFVELPKG